MVSAMSCVRRDLPSEASPAWSTIPVDTAGRGGGAALSALPAAAAAAAAFLGQHARAMIAVIASQHIVVRCNTFGATSWASPLGQRVSAMIAMIASQPIVALHDGQGSRVCPTLAIPPLPPCLRRRLPRPHPAPPPLLSSLLRRPQRLRRLHRRRPACAHTAPRRHRCSLHAVVDTKPVGGSTPPSMVMTVDGSTPPSPLPAPPSPAVTARRSAAGGPSARPSAPARSRPARATSPCSGGGWARAAGAVSGRLSSYL